MTETVFEEADSLILPWLATRRKQTKLMRLLPALPELLCEPGSMTARLATKILSWTVIVPLLAAVLLAFTWGRSIGVAVQIIVAFALAAAVLAAVNHAEV